MKSEQAAESSVQNPQDLGVDVTTVIDAGARYGMHPSWREFEAPLRYFAFEPDGLEAQRLREQRQHPGYEVVSCGLAREEGERDLLITKNRGFCSFLEVDLESDWFNRYRRGEGDLESVQRVKTNCVDSFSKARKLRVDFLKVETEGTELEVLQGAETQLSSSILGCRVHVNFQPHFKNQALFSDIHDFLTAKGFFLLNLDYFGRGVPRYGLFGNPDPLSLDSARYGVLVGSDAVWLRKTDWVFETHDHASPNPAYSILRYSYFCFLNNAPDVALDALMTYVGDQRGQFSPEVAASELYTSVRKIWAVYLGQWRVNPDQRWELARSTFKTVFGLNLEAGNKYWELIQRL